MLQKNDFQYKRAIRGCLWHALHDKNDATQVELHRQFTRNQYAMIVPEMVCDWLVGFDVRVSK